MLTKRSGLNSRTTSKLMIFSLGLVVGQMAYHQYLLEKFNEICHRKI